ncbi:MAG: hypothetical protein ACK4RK_01355 [Gemmataceae bacterium]
MCPLLFAIGAKLWRLALPLTVLLLLHGSALLPRAQEQKDHIRLQPSLGKGMEDAALRIRSLLTQLDMQNHLIGVGQFSGPSSPPSASGPEINRLLTAELKKLKLNVNTSPGKAPQLEISGKYRHVSNLSGSNQMGIYINIAVDDATGKTLANVEQGILNNEDLAKVVPPTVPKAPPPKKDLPKDEAEQNKKRLENDKVQNDVIAESITNPRFTTERSTRIKSAPSSKYAIEILVAPKPDGRELRKDLYRPTAAQDRDGLAYVTINEGECYAITCHNDTDYDALVNLTIDGVNVFTFSEEGNYPGYLVRAHQSLTVFGWYRTAKESNAFLVSEYSKSVNARLLKNEALVGTISAQFSPAWGEKDSPPPDEPLNTLSATSQGPSLGESFKIERRFSGKVRDIITVRYEKVPPKDLPPGR